MVEINGSDTKKAIENSLNLIGYKFEKASQSIVIKPNLCYYWDYSTGQTTDPKFVAALIETIRENTSPKANISIVESDASAMRCKYAFKMLGYEKLAHEYKVKLVNLSEDKTETVEVPVDGHKLQLSIPQTIQNADLRINVPKIKYSPREIKITCALKNIFGCAPYAKKFKYHPHISEVIVAINKALKFDLCIIDGNIVSGVQPRKIGLVMASRDPVAIDVAAAKIAGINPKTIRYLKLAAKEGLGQNNFMQRGIPIEYFIAQYPRRDAQKKLRLMAFKFITLAGLSKRLGLA